MFSGMMNEILFQERAPRDEDLLLGREEEENATFFAQVKLGLITSVQEVM